MNNDVKPINIGDLVKNTFKCYEKILVWLSETINFDLEKYDELEEYKEMSDEEWFSKKKDELDLDFLNILMESDLKGVYEK